MSQDSARNRALQSIQGIKRNLEAARAANNESRITLLERHLADAKREYRRLYGQGSI